MAPKFPRDMPTADRIRAAVIVDDNGCWVWQRARVARDKYGVLSVDGVQTYAHRAAYAVFVGPIEDGMTIDHLCMNKGCCNPAHLEAVPIGENVKRAIRIGHGHANAPTTCLRGHDWSVYPPNISRRANGTEKRDCSVCTRIRRQQGQIRRSA